MDIDILNSSPILPSNRQHNFERYQSVESRSANSTPSRFAHPPNNTSSPILNTMSRRRLFSE